MSYANLTNPIFADETAAREYPEAQRLPHEVNCVYCGSLEGIMKVQGEPNRQACSASGYGHKNAVLSLVKRGGAVCKVGVREIGEIVAMSLSGCVASATWRSLTIVVAFGSTAQPTAIGTHPTVGSLITSLPSVWAEVMTSAICVRAIAMEMRSLAGFWATHCALLLRRSFLAACLTRFFAVAFFNCGGVASIRGTSSQRPDRAYRGGLGHGLAKEV
jgi:hypothetical protein